MYQNSDWNKEIAFDIGRYSIGFCISAWTWQLRSLINPFIVGHFMDARAVAYVGLCVRIVEMLTLTKTVVLSGLSLLPPLPGYRTIQKNCERRSATEPELQALAMAHSVIGLWMVRRLDCPLDIRTLNGPR